jgi:hypothetical protein
LYIFEVTIARLSVAGVLTPARGMCGATVTRGGIDAFARAFARAFLRRRLTFYGGGATFFRAAWPPNQTLWLASPRYPCLNDASCSQRGIT